MLGPTFDFIIMAIGLVMTLVSGCLLVQAVNRYVGGRRRSDVVGDIVIGVILTSFGVFAVYVAIASMNP